MAAGDSAFDDSTEALRALEADRARLRRRVRGANWWYYPTISVMVAAVIASPTIERATDIAGFWVSLAAAGGVTSAAALRRRQSGLSVRLSSNPRVVITGVLLGSIVLVMLVASFLAGRFNFEGIAAWFPLAAFAITLLGALALDRFSDIHGEYGR